MRSVVSAFLWSSVVALLVQAQNSYVPGPRTSPFQHIVVIFQENRTPDNLFYGLCSPPYGRAASCSTTPDSSH
ncbi:MAG: hypothetical protein JO217_09705 [Acidobacteriaceae bacterium]|nr:hypothetical protein [Acidobacteriaceae bacterium]